MVKVICKFCNEEVEPDWETSGDGSEVYGYCPECKNENHIAFDSKYGGDY